MGLRARDAIAEDYARAGQKHANIALSWGIASAIAYYFWGWKGALLPGVLAFWQWVLSIDAQVQAEILEARMGHHPDAHDEDPNA